jgi:hypothetical protein
MACINQLKEHVISKGYYLVFIKEWLKQLHANRGNMPETKQLEIDVAGNNKWGSFLWLQCKQMLLSFCCYRQNTLLPCISANACYDSFTCHCDEMVTNLRDMEYATVYRSVNMVLCGWGSN